MVSTTLKPYFQHELFFLIRKVSSFLEERRQMRIFLALLRRRCTIVTIPFRIPFLCNCRIPTGNKYRNNYHQLREPRLFQRGILDEHLSLRIQFAEDVSFFDTLCQPVAFIVYASLVFLSAMAQHRCSLITFSGVECDECHTFIHSC